MAAMSDITHLLRAIEQGEQHAAEQLLPLVYDELRRLAASKLARESPGQTLQPTALVHEAYLRLVGGAQAQVAWDGRRHFFAAAAEAMRCILIDNARRKRSVKHGGQHQRVELDEAWAAPAEALHDVLAVDEVLTRLAAEEPANAELVKLRYFAGLSLEEAAQVLGISLATVKRRWAYARAWLYDALRRSE
jgi:RNA polymerase sigma factor (TIGR02999 family)